MHPPKSRLLIITAALSAVAGYWIAVLDCEPPAYFSELSPQRDYRLEWVEGTSLDKLIHHGDMIEPGIIRLYNNRTGQLVDTTPMVDIGSGSYGQPSWMMSDMGWINVGTGADFLHIHPLDDKGNPLPIQHEWDGRLPEQR